MIPVNVDRFSSLPVVSANRTASLATDVDVFVEASPLPVPPCAATHPDPLYQYMVPGVDVES
jgi:hypothetical protein